jgi:sarcosine oxidase, subunit gamma
MRDLRAMRAAPQLITSDPVAVLPPAARWVLRAAEPARAAAAQAFGTAIPTTACRAATHGERAALWLGPDEWLLIAPPADADAAAAALAAALRDLPHSLVDVSHRQGALGVGGPLAVTLLAAGCPLDLDARAFPPGMCTRTVLAKAEVVLWRTGADSFRLEVWRSFLDYVAAFLAEATRGII